uniref:Uncharacterized protein n=1 Tax=Daucus carota subsp. sativus TaxID=79200 RepID=A0A166D3B5_DAUCS
MFGRECARILRARSCSTRLVFPSNQYCWVLGDIRAAVPLNPFSLVADEYAILADSLQKMIVTEVLLLMEKAMNVPTSTQDSEQCLDSSPLVFSFGHQSIHAIAEMSNVSIANYLEMVYNKKASLLANSCKAIAILSGKDEEVTTMAFDYGKYLVYAYQLMDDIADITGRSATSGNLSSNFSRGMLGSPMLYAIEEFPQLRTFVDRGFKNPSELDLALEYLKKSRGMQRTRELATKYAGLALEAIESLPRSNNKDTEVWRRALVDLAQNIIRSSQVSKDICWV